MAVSGNVSASASVKETKAAGLGTATAPLSISGAFTLVDGTGTTKVDQEYSAARTLAGAANEDLVLSSASTLKTALGTSIAIVKLKALVIVNPATNTTTLTIVPTILGIVGSAGGCILPPGGFFAWASPIGATVTLTTADKINVANAAGASATYQVLFAGASA